MAYRDREMGARIRAARLDKGWKQKELARAVNVEPTTVSRWERAANAPEMDKLLLIAGALDQPISYFTAHLDGPATAPTNGDGTGLSAVRLEERVEALQQSVERLEQMLRDTLAQQQ